MARVFSGPRAAVAAMKIATVIDRPLMRWSNGRLRLSFPVPVLLLESVGRHSGHVRYVPLLYVPSPSGALIVGSNAGLPRPPAWCANLRAVDEVDCAIDGVRRRMRVRELFGAEYERAWAEAVDFYGGYDAYRQRAGRALPLFRLEALLETLEET